MSEVESTSALVCAARGLLDEVLVLVVLVLVLVVVVVVVVVVVRNWLPTLT